MLKTTSIASSIVLACCLSITGLVYADNNKFILDDERLKEIFSGMTFDGYHHKKDTEIKRYFASDGKMFGINPGRGNVHGTWWIGGGRFCFEWSHKKKTKCRHIEYSSGQVMIYKQSKKGDGYLLRVSFINRRPGNPLNFN